MACSNVGHDAWPRWIDAPLAFLVAWDFAQKMCACAASRTHLAQHTCGNCQVLTAFNQKPGGLQHGDENTYAPRVGKIRRITQRSPTTANVAFSRWCATCLLRRGGRRLLTRRDEMTTHHTDVGRFWHITSRSPRISAHRQRSRDSHRLKAARLNPGAGKHSKD
jgi:hypothetical protein